MQTKRRLIAAVAVAALGLPVASGLRAAPPLPASLADREFWALTDQLSEPNGFFRSDNLLSNERGYQIVIPQLVARVKSGGVYLGVGPEQNFPYIAAIKPQMAFIIDIRRGNLDEQLMYKALFELSTDRADFLSRLFSRKRPDGLPRQATLEQLFTAYDGVQPSDALFAANLQSVADRLTKTHGFPLSDSDLKGLEHAYRDGFFTGGPQLNYNMGTGGGGRNSPTYEELMLATDTAGVNRGYLASDEAFAVLKKMEAANLIVPVVGDFGGPKAIRAVGQYVKEHDGTVVAFYLSNVEQFLEQSGTWRNFCASVGSMPLDDTSTFIFSGRGAPYRPAAQFGGPGGGLATSIRPMLPEVRGCS